MREVARQFRRSQPIAAYVGPNGSGKTLAMIYDTLPSLDAGRAVYSTVPLYDEAGQLHPAYIPFTGWHQFVHAEHADFLMDEIIGIASSRESSSMHEEIQNRLNQLRKADLRVRWTAPAWPRADKILREVTYTVTVSRGSRTDHKVNPGEVAGWAPKRSFLWRTYDREAMADEFTIDKAKKVRPVMRERFWGPGSRAFAAYNTLDAVERLEPYDPNLCSECGLKIRIQYCKGHFSLRVSDAVPVELADSVVST